MLSRVLLSLPIVFVACEACGDIRYLYDDLNRLVRVIREDGEAATYHYDATGNILAITRESGVPQTTVVTAASVSVLPRGQTTPITLTGFNFAGAAVTAGAGIVVGAIHAGVDTLVVEVTVASGAASGPGSLTVSTPYGLVTIPVTIVGDPPVVSSFAPARALPGMVVAVTGAEFDAAAPASNVARVNGVQAPVLRATATTLTLRVPEGASTGPVSVTTLAGTGTSSASLVVGSLGPARASVPGADLLAYWTFDLDGRDDADSLDLALQGGLGATAPGAIGQGLVFQGNPAQVAVRPVSDPALNFGAGDFSCALWARWASVAGEQVLVEKCQGATFCSSGFTLTKLSNQMLLANPLVASAPGAIVAGHWYHVAVTREADTARLYLDGVEISRAVIGELAVGAVGDPFRIGERAGPQAFPMNGVIDEVGIWTRALTPAEVAGLASTRPAP